MVVSLCSETSKGLASPTALSITLFLMMLEAEVSKRKILVLS